MPPIIKTFPVIPFAWGVNTQVQFNDNGVLQWANNVNIEGGNLKLDSTTDPSAPTWGLILYSKEVAGRHLPKIVWPSGIDTILQVGLHWNNVAICWFSSTTSAPTQFWITLTTATTISAQFTAWSTNQRTATARKRFQSAVTAASNTGMRTAYWQWFRGNAAWFWGFFFRTQFGTQTNSPGSQLFMWLCASTAALATTAWAVSALVNMCWVWYDTTDTNTGNRQFYRNDGSWTATKVDLWANAVRNTTHWFDLIMFNTPNSGTLYVRITNLNTGVVVLDTSYTTDLPAVNTAMAFKAETNNGAVAAAQNIEVAKVYIETDY